METFAAPFWTPEEDAAELLLPWTLGRYPLYLDVVLLTSRAMARWPCGWSRTSSCTEAQQMHCCDMRSSGFSCQFFSGFEL